MEQNHLKLIDFGLAEHCEPGEYMETAFGTVLYVAPEPGPFLQIPLFPSSFFFFRRGLNTDAKILAGAPLGLRGTL